MYWIPKLHKNPIGSRFIIASPKCSIKTLAKDLTKLFKVFFDMVGKYYFKGKCWSGLKHFWVTQNNKEILNCINKLNSKKQAKIFLLLTLLLYILKYHTINYFLSYVK